MTHQNHELEAIALGALLDAEGGLLKSTAAKLLAETGLTSDDFTESFLRAAVGSVSALAGRERPVDPATVWTLLKGTQAVPGDGYGRLRELQGSNACNRAALSVHALELKRLTRLRVLESFHRGALTALEAKGADPATLAADLDTFAKGFSGAEEDFYSGEKDIEVLMEEWDAAARGERQVYLPTGIQALDEVITGYPENLTIVAGASSIGKSALVYSSILNAMLDGHRVAVFGLEDGTKGMQERFVALKLGLPVKAVGSARLNEYQRERVESEVPKLWNLARNCLLAYQPKDGERIPSSKLLQLTKRAIVHHRVRAVFIDHGLEIEHAEKYRGEEMRLRVGRTFSQLRSLAFIHHVPIVVVLHLNREGAKVEGPPRQEQLAEAADAERVARLILGAWALSTDTDDTVRVSVLKQTKGRRRAHLLLNRETEQALVRSVGGCEFVWPPPKEPRRSGEKGGLPWVPRND